VVVPAVLNTVEQTGLSMWLRNSDSIFGFYFVLLLHTLGLSLLVGPSIFIDLRMLGVAPDLPLRSLEWLFKIMWTGLGINATTGILLLIAYPTKALTNPMFYIKLTLIAVSVSLVLRIKRRVFDDVLSESAMIEKGKGMAKWSLGLWVGAITAGRLLAYTYRYLLYGVYAVITSGMHMRG
jgi:hypothetical protein